MSSAIFDPDCNSYVEYNGLVTAQRNIAHAIGRLKSVDPRRNWSTRPARSASASATGAWRPTHLPCVRSSRPDLHCA